MTLAIFKAVLCENLKCVTQLDHKKEKDKNDQRKEQ